MKRWQAWESSDREALIEAIGRYALNEVHRQLLLGATSELWVEYLTRIEALRVLDWFGGLRPARPTGTI